MPSPHRWTWVLPVALCATVGAAACYTVLRFCSGTERIVVCVTAAVAALALAAATGLATHLRDQVIRYREAHERAERAAANYVVESEARFAAAHDAATAANREASGSENRRVAAMAAFAGAAGRMQAMTTSMLAELREMEHRHGDPAVLADLLALDHRTAQAGRLADSVAVLSGARSGRRWAKPIAMESILRGAMGRVAGYRRVRLRAIAEIAIAGHAAEGVMHTLAELIDNACNFSPPTTEVHVYAAEVPAGVVVTIEDSGLVMSDSALRRAEQAVSGAPAGAGADLSSLTGTRLGLAVVGNLARKHTLTVSYRPSAIGGTAVVVVIPRDLTTRLDRAPGSTAPIRLPPAAPLAAPPAARPFGPPVGGIAERREVAEAPVEHGGAPIAPAAGQIAEALPKRRRGSTFAAVHPDGLPGATTENSAYPPARPAALGAFQRAFSAPDTDAPPTASPSTASPSTASPSTALEHDR
ncbi:sensor histidine kinase [Nocardia spumae]|uniref:sensor histidine kinase n=1 Tax=Nocardia spumae TaxID=2887190 RepID=UPI001D15192F|nr:ATP-binding protein [Nocardia spumae]